MPPLDRHIRIGAALIAAAGLAACGVAIFSEQLGLGSEVTRGVFGWKRISLLATGAVILAVGALLVAHPQIVAGRLARVRRYLRSLPLPSVRRLGSPADMRAQLRSWRTALIASGLLTLAAFIPRAITAGNFQNIDEITWMRRSASFGDALFALDFSAASAATTGAGGTMPGVTTMWLGAIAGGIWSLGRTVGIVDDQGPFAVSEVGLDLAQFAMAGATSVLIGLLVFLAWRWAGAIAAVAAGALLATEPFIVAQGAVLHTDELLGLFAATGTLALLIALGVPGGETTRPRAAAVLAGVLLAGASLTKLSAGLLAPGLAVIVAWALVRAGAGARARGAPTLATMRPVAALLGIVVAAGIVTTLLAWPAIWADPLNQIGFLRESAALAGSGHRQFFRGEVVSTPVPLLYMVATPFLMTPWFLVGTVAAVPAAAIVRASRPRLAILAAVAIPAFVSLSLAAHQFDRYVLLVLPFLALAVGVGVDAIWTRLSTRLSHARPGGSTAIAVGIAAVALAFTHTVSVAPWGPAYFNPLLGGSRAAERTILVGGSAGLPLAGERIEQLEAPTCDVTIAVLPYPIPGAFPCGSPHSRDHPDPDYFVIEISGRQRSPGDAEAIRASGRTVGMVTVRGITLAEIIDRREQPPPRSEEPRSENARTPGSLRSRSPRR